VVTLHRPSNVDVRGQLELIANQLVALGEQLPLVFPVHPRTRERLEDFGLTRRLEACTAIHMTEPLSYIEFMSLILDCRLALTDSGGVQEETSYLGIPCLTLRDNTERPVTVTLGTNRLIKAATMQEEVERALRERPRAQSTIPLWDGRTAARVVASLKRRSCVGDARSAAR